MLLLSKLCFFFSEYRARQHFPFNQCKPTGQNKPFGNSSDANSPPDTVYSHAHADKQNGERNTHVVAGDADNGRWNGASDTVEYTLCRDLEHHKELIIPVDAEKPASCFLSGLYGHKASKDFVSEKYKKQGAERTEN